MVRSSMKSIRVIHVIDFVRARAAAARARDDSCMHATMHDKILMNMICTGTTGIRHGVCRTRHAREPRAAARMPPPYGVRATREPRVAARMAEYGRIAYAVSARAARLRAKLTA
jgi:hypothetical protein